MRAEEHTITTDYGPVYYRSAPDAEPPVLYLHGAGTSSDDWIPFVERTGGIAPDLIGFGRSAKGGHLDYSPEGLAGFVERFLEDIGVERVRLVGHEWGAAIGLLLAARDPARVERLVLIDAVPLLPGYRWHRIARLSRRPVIGELAMGSATRSMLARVLRGGAARPETWTEERVTTVWEHFDQGTQRALLRLHRAAGESRLAELGASISELGMPTLIVWGERDPWFGPELADRYAARLPQARIELIAGAGHWPWLDRPEVIDVVAGFLAGA